MKHEDEQVKTELNTLINETLLRIIISNPRVKSEDGIAKIKIRPVLIAGDVRYQVTEYVGTQVLHKNYECKEVVAYVFNMLQHSFKQCEILTPDVTTNILVSKKGKMTISKKRNKMQSILSERVGIQSHNRKKNYILQEGIPVPFLIDLGVMNTKGEVLKPKYDKFKQINRFLEFIRDILPALPKDREIRILDFGCGKSYLTFAIYYYLHELQGLDVSIIGLDLKKAVIEKCNQLSNSYGYDKLIFKMGDIAQYQSEDNQVDMVVTLHACDTATDYALCKAVKWGAKVILSVPCCQHELNGQIENDMLAPVLKYGLIKERMAALFTDALRAEVLESKGYDVQILEFIDMEHTPKNILIRAVKGNGKKKAETYSSLMEFLHVKPTLAVLQQEEGNTENE